MSLWRRSLIGLGVVKLAAGLLVAVAMIGLYPEMWSTRLPVMTLYVVVFGLASALLSVGARGNRAGRELGVAYLLITTAFAEGAISSTPETLAAAEALTVLEYLQVDAFLPFLFWRFVGAFPAVTLFGRWRRTLRFGTALSLAVGWVLFAANLLMFVGRAWAPLSEDGVLGLVRRSAGSFYWQILFIVLLGAFVFGLVKTRLCPIEERRRATLFISSVVAGSAPLVAAGLLVLVSPRFATAFLEAGPAQARIHRVLDLFLLSIPFTSAYAVLVHRVIPLQALLRRAIRYALARYSLLTATAVPFVLLAGLLYQRRDQTLDTLLSGPSLLVLGSLTLLGIASLRWRGQWLTRVDRRFFREQYDARQILLSLAEKARGATSPQALSNLLREEIDRALHLTAVEVLLRDDPRHELRAAGARLRPLPLDSELARRVWASGEALEIDLEREDGGLEDLTLADRHWLVDGGFRLLSPLAGSSRQLIGLLALGEKRSGLPFSSEDLELLAGIAAAASLRLEVATTISSASQAATLEQGEWAPGREAPVDAALAAQECGRCGRIEPATGEPCASCGGPVSTSELPAVLAGKFRFESRLGAGGMGVVYRATDLDLGRTVAIKSLPSMTARQSMRLRREARAMAAVSHPNLALIFGAESWRGRPLLVFEFLAGGDLAAKLASGPLPIAAALALARAMADVTRKIHSHGILHRDIKPSNIGFTEDRTPKLLDFGLAKLLLDGSEAAGGPDGAVGAQDQTMIHPGHGRRPIMGTIPYLSPEALDGREPDYSFDLWSLTVVLFECLTGVNPFRGPTREETIARIRRGPVPELGRALPDAPRPLARFLTRALSPDPRRRPVTAGEFLAELEALSPAPA